MHASPVAINFVATSWCSNVASSCNVSNDLLVPPQTDTVRQFRASLTPTYTSVSSSPVQDVASVYLSPASCPYDTPPTETAQVTLSTSNKHVPGRQDTTTWNRFFWVIQYAVCQVIIKLSATMNSSIACLRVHVGGCSRCPVVSMHVPKHKELQCLCHLMARCLCVAFTFADNSVVSYESPCFPSQTPPRLSKQPACVYGLQPHWAKSSGLPVPESETSTLTSDLTFPSCLLTCWVPAGVLRDH